LWIISIAAGACSAFFLMVKTDRSRMAWLAAVEEHQEDEAERKSTGE
jgi:hypothetical protein